jgi:hypothetical protein
LSIYLVLLGFQKLVGFGKRNRLSPVCEPQLTGCHYDFFGLLFQQFILRSQPPSTTPCPVFLSGNNWILNLSHYQLLPMVPRKNIFWNICICDISWKTLIISQKLMKYREKTWNWEGLNLSSIPELLGFGLKNPAVLFVDR